MKKILLFLLFLMLLGFSFSVWAQIPQNLLQASHHIYSNSFQMARTLIDNHIQKNPEDPSGYLLRGISNEWFQVVHNKGKSLEGAIRSDYKRAEELAEEQLKKDSSNLDKKMMVGNTLMYLAKKHLDEGKKFRAGSVLKKAKKIMEDVVAKEPENKQAYFAIGLFNYFADNVPRGLKWLAALLGFRGDREKGLYYIQKAATADSVMQGDAKYMLVYIYSRKEADYVKALVYAEDLYRQYPKNPIFLFNLSEMQMHNKKDNEARQGFARFLDYCATRKSACEQKYRYLANFFITKSYMNQKNYEMAKRYISKANEQDTLQYKDRTEELRRWVELLEKL